MLDLEEVRQEGMSMDSKLLLSWADASQWTVELDEYGCSIPGICMAITIAALATSCVIVGVGIQQLLAGLRP